MRVTFSTFATFGVLVLVAGTRAGGSVVVTPFSATLQGSFGPGNVAMPQSVDIDCDGDSSIDVTVRNEPALSAGTYIFNRSLATSPIATLVNTAEARSSARHLTLAMPSGRQ